MHDEVLIRRYSETRRRHPLSGDDVADGVQRDREILADLRHRATVIACAIATVSLGLSTLAAVHNASHAERAAEEALEAERIADVRVAEARRQMYLANVSAAQSALEAGDPRTARHQLRTAPQEYRAAEWAELAARAGGVARFASPGR